MAKYTVVERRNNVPVNKAVETQKIIAQGDNLKQVLSDTKKYLTKNWAVVIEVRNNNQSPFNVSAFYLAAYGHKFLARSFKHYCLILR